MGQQRQKHQHCTFSATKQAIRIKLATSVGHFLWPWLCKCLCGCPSCFNCTVFTHLKLFCEQDSNTIKPSSCNYLFIPTRFSFLGFPTLLWLLSGAPSLLGVLLLKWKQLEGTNEIWQQQKRHVQKRFSHTHAHIHTRMHTYTQHITYKCTHTQKHIHTHASTYIHVYTNSHWSTHAHSLFLYGGHGSQTYFIPIFFQPTRQISGDLLFLFNRENKYTAVAGWMHLHHKYDFFKDVRSALQTDNHHHHLSTQWCLLFHGMI